LLTTAASPPCPLLSAAGLSCRRGRHLLFESLSFSVEPRCVTWLRGANGSGKTSLLRMLAGLTEPSAGQVLLNRVPWCELDSKRRKSLAYVGHQNALKDGLTLGEALSFLASLQGLDSPRDRARHALDRLSLGRHWRTPVRHLSQGMRRRGALARLALDDAPRVWLLDEPLDALDDASVAGFAELVDHKLGQGSAVLLTSHQSIPWTNCPQLHLGGEGRRP
jgi:heme exporter protein A